jgi:hypothetical protein
VHPVAEASDRPRQPASCAADDRLAFDRLAVDRLAGDNPDRPRDMAKRVMAASNSGVRCSSVRSTGGLGSSAPAEPSAVAQAAASDKTATAPTPAFRTDRRTRRYGVEAFEVVMAWLLFRAEGVVPAG